MVVLAVEERTLEPGYLMVLVGSAVQEGKTALQPVLTLTDRLKFRCNLLSEKLLVGWRSLGAEQYADATRFSDGIGSDLSSN